MAELKGLSSPYIQKKGQLDLKQNLSGNIGRVKLSGKMGSSLISTAVSVVSWVEPNSITYAVGTIKESIIFPTHISVTFSNFMTYLLLVNSWDEVDVYNKDVAGLYEFSANIDFPITVLDPPIITINVLLVNILASGGSVSTEGDYKIHKFINSGTFTLQILNQNAQQDIKVLIVGGGGAGGPIYSSSGLGVGGGGGAGQVIEDEIDQSDLSTGNFNVVVGAAGITSQNAATSGGDSSVFGLTAIGGGRGGYQSFTNDKFNGAPGGCGGGGAGSYQTSTAGAGGVGSFGGNGGFGRINPRSGGGGGGAGGDGQPCVTPDNNYGGAGGAGLVSDISGESVEYGKGGNGAGWYVNVFFNQNTGHGGHARNGQYPNTDRPAAKGIVIVKYKFQNF